MAPQRIDIERALDELACQEGGFRFQGLAVVIGKQRWPELIARQRKKDFGLDAYAPASETPEKFGKGLAASITPSLRKVTDDVIRAKQHYPDLRKLLFVTPNKVGNVTAMEWRDEIQNKHGVELHIIEREEIITLMMMPQNASLCSSFLYLNTFIEPEVGELINRTRRAAANAVQHWTDKLKGRPLIDLKAMQFDEKGVESGDVLSLEQIGQELSQSSRIVLEGPAGRGKTTSLIQISQRQHKASIPFIVELPSWTTSRKNILEYIAGMPVFIAEKISAAHLVKVQQSQTFLFLLNGWNEIAESSSSEANLAIRELERDFPSAGIIVATRTHHLTPPLPGAMRLRLLRLGQEQRTDYLKNRLGTTGEELQTRIKADSALDELTRTPFILSEVCTLFECGAVIPSTKIGVITQVIRLQEERDEHRNSLRVAPIFDQQTDYLKDLANEMTRCGGVSLSQTMARTVIANAVSRLVESGQIEPVGAPAVLACLTAHHLLERVEYPHTEFRFEHQQFQEYYSAIDLREQLFNLLDKDNDATIRFTENYVNQPAWSEPLRMIAEDIADQSDNEQPGKRNIDAGNKLIRTALMVDLVFAGELSYLCGTAVWNTVREEVGDRFRAVYVNSDGTYRQYVIAAMIATGKDEFSNILLPLLSGSDQQVRLDTYRIWPNFRLSSLGENWREQVRSWSEEARVEFIYELRHHRIDDEIACFAMGDSSVAVKRAAVSSFIWNGSEDVLIRILDSMDVQTFEEIVLEHPLHMPTVFRSRTISAIRKFIRGTNENMGRLKAVLNMIKLGESDLDSDIKSALEKLPRTEVRKHYSHCIRPALAYLRNDDPFWTSNWVATQFIEGVVNIDEDWLQFLEVNLDELVETFLRRLETENLEHSYIERMISVIAKRADTKLVTRIFVKLREVRGRVDSEPGQQHQFEWQVIRQLETVFRQLPDDQIAEGILSSVTCGNPIDIKITAELLSRAARPNLEPLRVVDADLKARLRTYLKSSIGLVLRQDDYNGEGKANLASSIAQVGKPEDMEDLKTLIRADINRMRNGRAARAAGDRGPLGNGGIFTYARWHINAVLTLDPSGAEQVLIDFLPEPEYTSEIAAAMARDFVPEPEDFFERKFPYDLMWAARESRPQPTVNDHRRTKYAVALKTEISRLGKETISKEESATRRNNIACALATIDSCGSVDIVLEVVSSPDQWHEYKCHDTVKRLLMAGLVIPVATVVTLIDSVMQRTENWMDESDIFLLCDLLALCPFVDDPSAGVAKLRDTLGKRKLPKYNICKLISSLGESRSDAAVELLYELASDAQTFNQCEDNIINAFAKLNTARANEFLLSFVDPELCGNRSISHPFVEDMLVERLTELARRSTTVTARLKELCELDLPKNKRDILSKVMGNFVNHEAVVASLNMIDDSMSPAIPQGILDQMKYLFLNRQPYGQNPHDFTVHSQASNEIRTHLFRMTYEDDKRRKSAFILLGKIEMWRLQLGRPIDEPRHPDLVSGYPWLI